MLWAGSRAAGIVLPRPPGNPRTRETFSGKTGVVFDELAPAASAVALTFDVLLDAQRAARMVRSGDPGFGVVIDRVLRATWFADRESGLEAAIQRQTADIALTRLLQLANNAEADAAVRALALDAIDELDRWLATRSANRRAWRAHYAFARNRIAQWRDDPASLDAALPVTVPPGSPIGAGQDY